MGNTVQLNSSHILKAVEGEVRVWQHAQIRAIDAYNSHNLPYVSELPAMFQAATWFGLGMDAAGKLTPGSAAAAVLSRAAVPLAILDYVTRHFARAHAKAANEQRLALAENTERFKSALINGINAAELHFYTDEAYGKPLRDKLLELTRQDQFAEAEKGVALLRETLKESGAVVTEENAIQQQTKQALEKVAQTVEHIYRVSTHGPAVHKQLKVSHSHGPFTEADFKVSNCRLTRDLLARMKPGQRVGYVDASRRNPLGLQGHPPGDKFQYVIDEKILNDFLVNAWRYESRHAQGGGFNQCHATWVWQATKPVDPNFLARSYQGSFQALEQTYRRLRPQYIAT